MIITDKYYFKLKNNINYKQSKKQLYAKIFETVSDHL